MSNEKVAMDLLLSGDFVNALIFPFTNVMGEWFYVMLILGILTVVHFRTQSPEAVGLISLLIGGMGLFAELMPGITETSSLNLLALFAFLTIFGLALTIWKPLRRDT